ncbi:MAG: ubiquinol-cytochrome c reductase iron-sulfur subunit [Pseudomonadota bacterium]
MAATDQNAGEEHTRRDFLYIATGAVAAIGVGGAAWPFIDQMNPDAASQALASTPPIDVAAINPGESISVMWRGKPVFIRRRTEEEVQAAKDTPLSDLPDQEARNPNIGGNADNVATDENRGAIEDEALLVMIGVCTHLGCIPIGEQGEFGGWFCPCHGSHYDTAGRIRKGPAPTNLEIPPYTFVSDNEIVVG